MDVGAYISQVEIVQFLYSEEGQWLLFSLFASGDHDGAATVRLPTACFKGGAESEPLPERVGFSDFLIEACEDTYGYERFCFNDVQKRLLLVSERLLAC